MKNNILQILQKMKGHIFNSKIKSIIKPIWTYGIPLWGTAAMSHINKIEKQGHTRDLGISTPKEEISRYAEKYKERIATHPNWLTAEAINI